MDPGSAHISLYWVEDLKRWQWIVSFPSAIGETGYARTEKAAIRKAKNFMLDYWASRDIKHGVYRLTVTGKA